MKTIIIEGIDRCGKDTVISHILSKFENSVLVHSVAPKGDTNEEKEEWQKKTFKRDLLFCAQCSDNDIFKDTKSAFVFNRSYLGECVYGPMYRGTDSSWVLDLEEEYLDLDNTYLIVMYADPSFIVSRDDGESFTRDIAKKEEEIDRFTEAYAKSKVKNKLLMQVNDGNDYMSLEKEFETIDSFLGI